MSERKYRQRGYQDTGKPEKKEKPRPTEGRPRQDHLGPRTPRMVGTVTRARCANCGKVLTPGFDPSGRCPACGFELHCCKQCVHFDTGAQFECTQPIPERISKKDARNECTFFEFRTTVEKDTSPTSTPTSPQATNNMTPDLARKAFDDLFKK
ncbi:MAG TPA: hypothetical protein VNL38_03100 [Candidatus Nitrosotenuis sp.]|nr:hypothetical protein [Candidatus Nitrosotenuis sp.]